MTRCSRSSTAASSSASARAARSSTSSRRQRPPTDELVATLNIWARRFSNGQLGANVLEFEKLRAQIRVVPVTRVRVIVRGRVQGVWFRESCRREADQRGVAGWARNRADGTVEAVFEGQEAAVAQVVAWCRIGPSRAVVTGVDVVQEPPEELVGFRVR